MIVQAIALLDDLDKEINIYAMRVKVDLYISRFQSTNDLTSVSLQEWYGWHFPEMAKIIVDNIAYAKVIKEMGMQPYIAVRRCPNSVRIGFRTNAVTTDFAAVLPEELEETLKAAASISMGTDISQSDMDHIHSLCDQVISISSYRSQLSEYLKNRMNAIAPNLTALVGDLVGARLISHAGSLLSLAKHPASTIQILGAEKALFRALKTKHDTPKYGLIYHVCHVCILPRSTQLTIIQASLIGQAPPKLKGKMARMVATKAALSIRVDALSDADTKSEDQAPSIGMENRAKLEARLHALEQQADGGAVRSAFSGKKQARFQMTGETRTYNTAADAVDLVPTQREPMEAAVKAVLDVKAEKKRSKEERKSKKRAEKEEIEDGLEEARMDVDEESKENKKEKKRKRRESEGVPAMDVDPEEKVRVISNIMPVELLIQTAVLFRDQRRRRSARRGKRQKRSKRRRLQRQKMGTRRKRRKSRRHNGAPPDISVAVLYCVVLFSVHTCI